jgi:hypothetical protein
MLSPCQSNTLARQQRRASFAARLTGKPYHKDEPLRRTSLRDLKGEIMSSSTITQRATTSTQSTAPSRRSGYVAFLKLLALTGVVLGIMFHWLEADNWMGLLAFLIDGFEVANQNLHDPFSFPAMQIISVLAHAGFVAGLMALLFVPLTPARGNLLTGFGQMLKLPSQGRGKWLTYGSVTALVILGGVLVGLS